MKTKVRLYHVTWEIDIWASTAEVAACDALSIQRDPTSMATIFDVTPCNDDTCHHIDVEEVLRKQDDKPKKARKS